MTELTTCSKALSLWMFLPVLPMTTTSWIRWDRNARERQREVAEEDTVMRYAVGDEAREALLPKEEHKTISRFAFMSSSRHVVRSFWLMYPQPLRSLEATVRPRSA